MLAAIWSLLGLAALIGGAEMLLRSGTQLARLLRISPMLIGLTIVSIGTSAPELAVGINASLSGSGSLAIGNIAGTNICNILLILGFSALLVPLALEARTRLIDLPSMVVAALTMVVLTADGMLSRTDGAILVALALLYTAMVIIAAKRARCHESGGAEEETRAPSGSRLRHATVLFLSLGIIVLGSELLVRGATDLARLLGVSEAFIGLTVIAIGTSSPELVTTIISTRRGSRDIAIGNLIGSSTYNIAFILGLTALVPNGGIAVEPALIEVDIPAMAAVALLCVPVFLSGRQVSRLEGGLFVLAYLGYLAYLIVLRG